MKADELREQQDEDLRGVLKQVSGRRFFHRLLVQSGLYASSYAEAPTAAAYNEGRRSIAIALMREAQRVAPELYSQGLREQLSAQELEARKAETPAED